MLQDVSSFLENRHSSIRFSTYYMISISYCIYINVHVRHISSFHAFHTSSVTCRHPGQHTSSFIWLTPSNQLVTWVQTFYRLASLYSQCGDTWTYCPQNSICHTWLYVPLTVNWKPTCSVGFLLLVTECFRILAPNTKFGFNSMLLFYMCFIEATEHFLCFVFLFHVLQNA